MVILNKSQHFSWLFTCSFDSRCFLSLRSQTSSFMNKLSFFFSHSLIDDRECCTLLSDAVAHLEASSLSWGMRRICKLTNVDNWFEHFAVIVCWSLRCVLVCNLNVIFLVKIHIPFYARTRKIQILKYSWRS